MDTIKRKNQTKNEKQIVRERERERERSNIFCVRQLCIEWKKKMSNL